MRIKFNNLYFNHKKLENKFVGSLIKHIRNSNFIGGLEVKKFENNFKKYNQSKYCISCANGSDALLIAIKALGIKKGDEVITTAFSWIATSAAITLAGGKVIFCDVEKDGFNIDPKQIESKISKKTIGIIPVHLYGYPCDMIFIMKIAKKYKLWVVEDCAQAHLSSVRGKFVGNFGDFGTFSFFPGKNLGALGDGGCLVTNNKNLANKARLIANHGGKGSHLLEGINSRLDAIQASFLNIKIKNLKKEIKIRGENAKKYLNLLKNFNINYNFLKKNFEFKSCFHLFVIKTELRDRLMKYLLQKGVETQIHYKKKLPSLPAYKYLKLNLNLFPNATKASKRNLCLPNSSSVSSKKIVFISNLIKNFFNNKNVLRYKDKI